MREIGTIAKIISVLIEDCNRCPLQRICNESSCSDTWEEFLKSEVKEDGLEQCKKQKDV